MPPSLLALIACIKHEWSTRWNPSGRPGRAEVLRVPAGPRLPDAIQAIYEVVKGPGPRRLWILDADLAGAFDRIAHGRYGNKPLIKPSKAAVRRTGNGCAPSCGPCAGPTLGW